MDFSTFIVIVTDTIIYLRSDVEHYLVIVMEKTIYPSHPVKLGRPLSFDREAALRQAMLTFWRYGYETTSMADLTAAMGVTAPSIYTAFGDKKQLFLEAVRAYAGDQTAMTRAIYEASTSLEAARDLISNAVTVYTGEATPKGCLLASATASGSAASADVQRIVADVRRGVQRTLQNRIERDVAEGMLPPTTDAAGLSGMVLALTQGMSVLARDGAPRASLLAIAKAALRAWPRQIG